MTFLGFLNRRRNLLMLSAGVLACFATTAVSAQVAMRPNDDLVHSDAEAGPQVISLDAPTGGLTAHATSLQGKVAEAPANLNFRQFADAQAGEPAGLETLTLRFATSTKLTKIETTKDFKVEQGGSCVEGNVYSEGQTCRMLVRFTPQGPGHRSGRITVSHTASAKPFLVGLGGNSYAAVLNFIPSVMSTVPASYPAGKGLLSGALNLAVDGGDTLYVADTGNNVIRSMDASGNFTTISSGALSAPEGVSVDTFGEVYFTEPAANSLYEIYAYGPQFVLNGTSSGACTVSAPCGVSASKVFTPGEMATDGFNRIFFVDGYYGAATFVAQSTSASYLHLNDPFTFQANTPGVIGVDSYDDLYSFWFSGSVCSISMQTLYNAENYYSVYQKAAGGKTCGFAGDGGPARNAEISNNVGQMAFDVAGNLYFTDTGNQRVRRIDSSTGQINTIAGVGTAGYSGDGGAGTGSAISYPTGVAVDSTGMVYFIQSTAASGGGAQVIRRIGPDGALPFGNTLKGASVTAPKPVILSNTGNSPLTFTRAQIIGPAAADYTIDPNTTTCILTTGATLANGQSCKVGITFKPTALGVRSATVQFLDNTVTGFNNIQLYGVGVLPSPTVTITSPASGASFQSGTTVPFSATVSYTSGAAPTGTMKFTVDGAAYGNPVTISNGLASVNLTGLTTANHTLGVTYSGDANYAAVGPVTRTISVTAASAKTTPVVKAAVTTNPVVACKMAVFSATVTAPSGTPSGVVKLQEGSTILATATLSNGVATLSTSALTAGTHTLLTYYPGDAAHNPGYVYLTQNVGAGSSCSTAVSGPIVTRGGPIAVKGSPNKAAQAKD